MEIFMFLRKDGTFEKIFDKDKFLTPSAPNQKKNNFKTYPRLKISHPILRITSTVLQFENSEDDFNKKILFATVFLQN